MRILLPITAPAALVLLVACGTSAPAPPGGLAFDVPSPPTATYTIGDSLELSVDSPMGSLAMKRSSAVTLAMSFARVAEGLRVTAEVEGFEASMTNPMSAPVSADVGDVTGSLIFDVGPTGKVEPVSTPTVSGSGAQLGSFVSLAHEFFPRLPGRVVNRGDSWVDTVSWSGGDGGAEVSTTTIYTYTLVGDTVSEGISLLRISVAGDVETDISVEMDGMQVDQSLTGSTTGDAYWDVDRNLLHSSDLGRSMTGTVSLPAMGLPPMPIKASGPVRTRIQR